jgi:hypothetical protein
MLQIFITLKKIHCPLLGLNLQTLGSMASTLTAIPLGMTNLKGRNHIEDPGQDRG